MKYAMPFAFWEGVKNLRTDSQMGGGIGGWGGKPLSTTKTFEEKKIQNVM